MNIQYEHTIRICNMNITVKLPTDGDQNIITLTSNEYCFLVTMLSYINMSMFKLWNLHTLKDKGLQF